MLLKMSQRALYDQRNRGFEKDVLENNREKLFFRKMNQTLLNNRKKQIEINVIELLL